jgi:hypothetical protein
MERKKANINRSVNRDILSAHGLVVRASGKYDAFDNMYDEWNGDKVITECVCSMVSGTRFIIWKRVMKSSVLLYK